MRRRKKKEFVPFKQSPYGIWKPKKKIGKEVFALAISCKTKRKARKIARAYREDGHKARVMVSKNPRTYPPWFGRVNLTGKTKYAVYYHKWKRRRKK